MPIPRMGLATTDDRINGGLTVPETRTFETPEFFQASLWTDRGSQMDLNESIERRSSQHQLNPGAAAGLGITLTAGFVSGALRAG